jgi:DNA topoisomerase IB
VTGDGFNARAREKVGPVRLRRSDLNGLGFRRRRRGSGFEYLDEDGDRLDDPDTLERIRQLAIPPAWTDVWICPYPNGHIQAVGVDAAGRKQYRYHDKWREAKDREKFEEMLEFARALPRLRARARRHLRQEGPTRERVLACAVRLLDRGFFRIGGEEYAEENGSFGVATLQKQHVKLGPENLLVFDYPAKSGKRRVQAVVDPQVYAVVSELKRRRGGSRELLAYKNAHWVDLRSDEINAYIKETAGGAFSAKHFRTWHATVIAAVALAVSGQPPSRTARKRAMTRAAQEVAHYLGNTPAIARASYIDPRVFDRFEAGVTIADSLDGLGDVELGAPATHGRIERAVCELLS